MEEKVGIIDCGTNTFHLMIASFDDDSLQIIFKEKVAVKIGEGGINQKIIIPEAYARAINTLEYFSSILANYNVNKTLAFATSAFRNASNGENLRLDILKRTNIDIEIISGDQEAELIFKGVDNGIHIGEDPAVVMDIGGGSVEFIIGSSENILWKQSFEIGAQRLLDLFHETDPMSENDIKRLNLYLTENLQPLIEAIDKWNPKTLVGSSGTFDTLSDIYCLQNGFVKNENDAETPLTLEAVNEIHNILLTKDRSERMQIPGMIQLRVDMIVVASCLIDFILNQNQFIDVRVSTHALKEGVLSEILKGELK